MRAMIQHLVAAALLLKGVGASACPLCLGWGQSSMAHQLVATPQAVLAGDLDGAGVRQCLSDPEPPERQSLWLLLLGISGNTRDAVDLEKRLQTAWQSGEAANLSSMLAADLELSGPARMAWVESNYLADRERSTPEIKAALLALSVHANGNGAISRKRVIQSYRMFMKAHPEMAGDVAPDLAAW